MQTLESVTESHIARKPVGEDEHHTFSTASPSKDHLYQDTSVVMTDLTDDLDGSLPQRICCPGADESQCCCGNPEWNGKPIKRVDVD